MGNRMRDVFPVKYYKDEGFVERKIEINEEDLDRIIEDYLSRHAGFRVDEIEVVNNRPADIWLYAKCRKYIDPEHMVLIVAGAVDEKGNPLSGAEAK